MEIKVYGGNGCAWCTAAKDYLDRKGQEYLYFNVHEDENALQFLKIQGFSSIPQIFVDGEHIGGYNDMVKEIK